MINEEREKLLGSFILFTQCFYEELTGREFKIPPVDGRESHYMTIAKALTKVFRGDTRRLLITVPPGFGKSTLATFFVAWCYAHYPDCNFLYISFSGDLAAEKTGIIKQIMSLPLYSETFGVHIDQNSRAKDDFKTTERGNVVAYGSAGSITGRDSGLPYIDRFSGCTIIDDIHKPSEVHSDTIREAIKNNYKQTIKPRCRSDTVPIICIGQRLHEDDVPANLINGYDGDEWTVVNLQAIDEAGNALCPAIISKEQLLIMEKHSPYVFASQFQQNPQPAGGGIFKGEWFTTLDDEPEVIATFFTVDGAETEKTYNDATVFSFWGIYKIVDYQIETDLWGIHWLDCWELRCEPHALESNFIQFYSECMRYKIKPKIAAIEKKSTGTTLGSVLSQRQGLQIIQLDRTLNKIDRFYSTQPYVASKHVTFPKYGRHNEMCITHLKKIAGNNSHRSDDIADTLADAVQLSLIDKTIIAPYERIETEDAILSKMNQHFTRQASLKRSLWQK